MKRHSAKLKWNITSLLNEGVSNLLWKTKQKMRKGKMTCENVWDMHNWWLTDYSPSWIARSDPWSIVQFLSTLLPALFGSRSSWSNSGLSHSDPGRARQHRQDLSIDLKASNSLLARRLGFHLHANALKTTVAYTVQMLTILHSKFHVPDTA